MATANSSAEMLVIKVDREFWGEWEVGWSEETDEDREVGGWIRKQQEIQRVRRVGVGFGSNPQVPWGASTTHLHSHPLVLLSEKQSNQVANPQQPSTASTTLRNNPLRCYCCFWCFNSAPSSGVGKLIWEKLRPLPAFHPSFIPDE